ncbi:MAG: hypothetical protein HKN43_16200 [Rhodothermales bacterium]|nr:hypothetical protein [Rhodothermales bacterium]
MKHLILPFALIFVLCACDSRDFDSDVFAQSNSALFEVAYEVSGTYAQCTIAFIGPDKDLETVATTLPWSKETFPVHVRGTQDSFNASVKATCKDDNRLGKSTVSVYVDGELKSRGATTGYGKTAEAQFLLLTGKD